MICKMLGTGLMQADFPAPQRLDAYPQFSRHQRATRSSVKSEDGFRFRFRHNAVFTHSRSRLPKHEAAHSSGGTDNLGLTMASSAFRLSAAKLLTLLTELRKDLIERTLLFRHQ